MKLTNMSVLLANIARVKENGDSLAGQIHDCIKPAALYIIKDGNTDPANALLDAINSTRIDRSAITAWLETFAPCYVKDDKLEYSSKRAKKYFPVHDDADLDAYADAMAKMRWYNFTKPKPAKSIFDPVHYLTSVIKKLEKEGVPAEAVNLVRMAWGKEVSRQKELEELCEDDVAIAA